jgi:hypothetical protein
VGLLTRAEDEEEERVETEFISAIDANVWQAVYVWRDADGDVNITLSPLVAWGVYETTSLEGRARGIVGMVVWLDEVKPATHALNLVTYVQKTEIDDFVKSMAVAKLEALEAEYGRNEHV